VPGERGVVAGVGIEVSRGDDRAAPPVRGAQEDQGGGLGDRVECDPEVQALVAVDALVGGILVPRARGVGARVLHEEVGVIERHPRRSHQPGRQLGRTAVVNEPAERLVPLVKLEIVVEETGFAGLADLVAQGSGLCRGAVGGPAQLFHGTGTEHAAQADDAVVAIGGNGFVAEPVRDGVGGRRCRRPRKPVGRCDGVDVRIHGESLVRTSFNVPTRTGS